MLLRRKLRAYGMRGFACLAAGCALGVMLAFMADGAAVVFAAGQITNYLQSVPPSGGEAFPEAFIKHLRVGAAVWLLGFWPRMSWLGYVLAAGKAAAFGYAVTLFGQSYGMWGVQKALALTGLQQLLLLPAVACVAVACRLYASRDIPMRAYAILGAGMIVLAAVVAAMDAFLWRAIL